MLRLCSCWFLQSVTLCSVCIQAATAEANTPLISSRCWHVVQLYTSPQAHRSLGRLHFLAGSCMCTLEVGYVCICYTCRQLLGSGISHEPDAFNLQVNAEIVITFEGTTEFGNDFMARQSYLPNELRWGHCFKDMLSLPAPGTTQYTIDFSGWVSVPLTNKWVAYQAETEMGS